MSSNNIQRSKVLNGYLKLLASVKKALIEGQERIEQERVKTYWETGRVIHTHILKHKDRAEYGVQVILELAKDLNVDRTILNRCVRFAEMYPHPPISAGGHQFSWSHYRELITISDDKKRSQLEKTAAEKGWSADELAAHIQESRPSFPSHQSLATSHQLKVPKVGNFYTYVTFTPPEVFAVTGEVMADLGFDVWHQLRVKDWPGAKFQKRSDYTYHAYVEKIIDGDTLWVNIDLGFKTFTRQKLRLSGIDAPELSTAAGVKAKAFVQKALKGVELITIVTNKNDKYDRYLADVWIPQPNAINSKNSMNAINPGDDIYLNQLLLDEGLAVIWK